MSKLDAPTLDDHPEASQPMVHPDLGGRSFAELNLLRRMRDEERTALNVPNALVDRLRGFYGNGPALGGTEPEFGWRKFLEPKPIELEAANRIVALELELIKAKAKNGFPYSRPRGREKIIAADTYRKADGGRRQKDVKFLTEVHSTILEIDADKLSLSEVWICESYENPTINCVYTEDDECCQYCGDPYERK